MICYVIMTLHVETEVWRADNGECTLVHWASSSSFRFSMFFPCFPIHHHFASNFGWILWTVNFTEGFNEEGLDKTSNFLMNPTSFPESEASELWMDTELGSDGQPFSRVAIETGRDQCHVAPSFLHGATGYHRVPPLFVCCQPWSNSPWLIGGVHPWKYSKVL